MINKRDLFEYFLNQVITWHCVKHKISIDDFNESASNDYSKLKLIKLHFFACSTHNDALDIFDDFYAMPYGHVESTIYSNLPNLVNYAVDNNKLTIVNSAPVFVSNQETKEVIDVAMRRLKAENKDIINLSPFSLVDLSHKWFSWQHTFNEARREHLYSKKISPELIKKETKIYHL